MANITKSIGSVLNTVVNTADMVSETTAIGLDYLRAQRLELQESTALKRENSQSNLIHRYAKEHAENQKEAEALRNDPIMGQHYTKAEQHLTKVLENFQKNRSERS